MKFASSTHRGIRVLGETGNAVPAASKELRSAAFRREREGNWRLLEGRLRKIDETGIESLTADEVEQLPLLYRLTVSSLSVARGMVLDRNLLLYLENLSLRAYLVVYGPRGTLVDQALDFVRHDFPRRVRDLRYHLLLAFTVFFAATLAGYQLVRADSNMFYLLVPDELAGGRGPDAGYGELREAVFAPFPGFVETFIVFANFLFRHNAVVGILSFGLGFVFGVPTILLLAYTGLSIGAMTAVYADNGMAVDFIGWLSIHGVTEILAILLCAASGFAVAEKIVFPGPLSRLDSLAQCGRAVAGVVVGAIGLFFIASILEGGFRQLFDSTVLRFMVAFATLAAWLYYFTRVGRDDTDGDAD